MTVRANAPRVRRCFYSNSPECLQYHTSGFTIPADDGWGGMFHIPICPECLDYKISHSMVRPK